MAPIWESRSGGTRATFTDLLVRSVAATGEGASEGSIQASPFGDVDPDSWAAASIVEAYERGWVRGYGDGTFRPGDVLSRAEAAVMVVRALVPFVPAEVAGADPADIPDLRTVPGWARREVAIALRMRWLVADRDGDLRLQDPLTFEEAGELIWRTMAITGSQYDATGVVERVDAAGGRIDLAGDAGDTGINVEPGAAVFRNGEPCSLDSIEPLDEAFIVLGASGNATFVEARFIDDVGFVDSVDGGAGDGSWAIWCTDRSGVTRRALVDADTEVYVQGNKSTLSEVSRGDRVYLVFDSVRGAVRIMDVAKINAGGRVVRVSAAASSLTVRIAGYGTETLGVDEYAVFYRDGKMCGLEDIREGDIFQGSVDAGGRVLFLQAFTAGAR